MRIHFRENWYRDVWLAVITIVLVLFSIQSLNASTRANRASQEAVRAVQAVQQSRLNGIRSECEASAQRNANTVSVLNADIAQLPAAEQKRAKATEQGTIALIDALAPRQNCDALVARARINQ